MTSPPPTPASRTYPSHSGSRSVWEAVRSQYRAHTGAPTAKVTAPRRIGSPGPASTWPSSKPRTSRITPASIPLSPVTEVTSPMSEPSSRWTRLSGTGVTWVPSHQWPAQSAPQTTNRASAAPLYGSSWVAQARTSWRANMVTLRVVRAATVE